MAPTSPGTLQPPHGKPLAGWRLRLYTIIFEADTRAGRWFDKSLIFIILASIAVVMADSVESLHRAYGLTFQVMEWGFTLLFTAEYIARLVCVRRPLKYAGSFFGLIDLLALLPTYLALFFPGLHALIDVRVLRLLRVFRVFKLTAYVAEYQSLGRALAASGRKILVFLTAVLMLVLVMGTVMYVVEGRENGYTSIPTSIYWAISTVTTVGFGDITPKTDLGRLISSFMMLLGWGILAVPTGIVTAEMAAHRRLEQAHSQVTTTRTCHECLTEGHTPDANYCFHCGARLPPYQQQAQAPEPG
jgi:voltage-gated potassium channel